MKNIMTIMASVMIALGASATQVTYDEVVPNTKQWNDLLATNGLNRAMTSELKDVKISDACSLYLLAENKKMYDEVDDFVANSTNVAFKYNGWIINRLTRDKFPKWFSQSLEHSCTDKPVTKVLFDKYGVLRVNGSMSINEVMSIVNAGELSNIGDIDSLNNRIKQEGVKIVKKYLRSKGKTFVSSKKVVDGKEVIINPLELPMKELTDSLNSARYVGFNEWIDKYNASWNKIDLSWLETEGQMKAIMDDILIDEKRMQDYYVKLRLHLGVDGFNAFVKEYNEGVAE